MSTISSNTKDLLSKILESTFYRIALVKAPRIARNADGLLKLLRNALQKTQKLGVGGVFDVIREKIEASAHGIDGIPLTTEDFMNHSNKYFEFHIRVGDKRGDILTDDDVKALCVLSRKLSFEYQLPIGAE